MMNEHPTGAFKALPVGSEATVTSALFGGTLRIKRVSARSYILRIDGQQRARWATYVREVREDIEHFLETGALPRSTGTSWA